ncbi:ABC transporter substrate-binding protein [Dechloromonas sp. ARDL1]|uniref:ABC transporter substrate-binding protein n=1 Tax=Dechloromonas sp. ARDL1 TaxID=3322121 RepID=UPI003DA74C60
MKAIRHILSACLIFAGAFQISFAETGITDNTIAQGMSVPLSGPASSQGQELKKVISAYFDQVNKNGGINGRKLQLTVMDDAYVPEKTVANTRTLIETNKVFALLGYYGSTAMTEAMDKVFGPAKVPMIGGISGAMSLRQAPASNPNNRYMFSQRASYADEAEAIGTQLATLGLKNIAVFYQNDGFGKAGLEGLSNALKKHKLTPSATGSVERNSEDIGKALEAIAKVNPQAVVMVTLHKPTAAMIKALRKANQSPMIMTLSPVSAEQLTQELGNQARGIGISQVMPYPWNDTVAIVKEYQQFIGKQGPYSYTSMEGFIIAKVAVDALRKAGGKDLSREKLVSALESMNQDFGGYRVAFGPNNRAGSQFVQLTVIGAGGKLIK